MLGKNKFLIGHSLTSSSKQHRESFMMPLSKWGFPGHNILNSQILGEEYLRVSAFLTHLVQNGFVRWFISWVTFRGDPKLGLRNKKYI